ncbi:MAG: response regulator [Bacteroidales bacterium]
MIDIILVDDHQIIRDGIKALLADHENLHLAGEAGDGSELRKILKTVDADIILLDISMPGESGIEICRDLQHNHPELRVIILSMYSSEEFVIQALQAGAWGYLPKNISREELVRAITVVYQGDEYISPAISVDWMKNLRRKARELSQPPSSVLSRRELEIIKLCAEGISNKEISERLFISIRTVESHKNHIMQKLELKSLAEMIKFALKNNLAEL